MGQSHLDILEAEAIYIMREVAAQFNNPALMFSGGKDSIVLVHLAIKAFAPASVPFQLLHVDTGHNFPEAIAFRDELVKKHDLRISVAHVQDLINEGILIEEQGKYASRNQHQIPTLLRAIDENKFDACIGGARRDEEKARAKERIFSVRDEFGQWNEKQQRPELFHMLNGRIQMGQNVRVFPISNWTELDVWEYIRRESIEIPSIYFAHERAVFKRDGLWWPDSDFVNRANTEEAIQKVVRFRTVGDMTCTAAVVSEASALDDVIAEIASSNISERGARIDDKRSDSAMETRKKVGYF